uniref:Uncharacterized protein n=1 Tax=Odontella aurita TaxID=265563 RepID=A0A7S4J5E4_9STRA|mmetsp:Transcript_38992/g.117231  ORF Transcript_38992/g.117231 Transcript_38992/m.117231 type:complete len:272 (+) Transcript_38992:80-895(+)
MPGLCARTRKGTKVDALAPPPISAATMTAAVPSAAGHDPSAPEPVVIDRGLPPPGVVVGDDGSRSPPPLEAFFQAKQSEDEFAFAYTFEDDHDDSDDDDSDDASGVSSDESSSSYASARSHQAAEPVREGASVKFHPDPVVEVRLRPVTSPDERDGLYYGSDDFRAFRREFRTLIKARRAAIRAQRRGSMQHQHRTPVVATDDADFHWNPLSGIVGAIASAAWNAVPEVIVRAESVSRQQAGLEAGSGSASGAGAGAGAVIPDRLLHHHGF